MSVRALAPWSSRAVPGRVGALPASSRCFSEALRYTRESLLRSEFIYGHGFQSPGGSEGLNKKLTSQMGLAPSRRVLDLGCGTGGTSFHFAKTYGCSVVGVDIQPACVELCNERKADAQDLVTFELGSFTESSLFPPGSFDAAYTRDAVLYLEGQQKDKAFANIFTWLKPGGLFMVTDYGKGTKMGEKGGTYERLALAYFDTLEEYKVRLERAGFVVEHSQLLPEFDEEYHQDLQRFIANKEEFLSRYGAEHYESLRERWVLKCGAIAEGSFAGLHLHARKPE